MATSDLEVRTGQFVEHLPSTPEVCKHVFRETKKDDDFVASVLKKVREDRRFKWKEIKHLWAEELDTFLLAKKGPKVFEEWLKIDYVRKLVDEKLTVKTIWEWRTLAHALADFKNTDLLTILLNVCPEMKGIEVFHDLSKIHRRDSMSAALFLCC